MVRASWKYSVSKEEFIVIKNNNNKREILVQNETPTVFSLHPYLATVVIFFDTEIFLTLYYAYAANVLT